MTDLGAKQNNRIRPKPENLVSGARKKFRTMASKALDPLLWPINHALT
jgi:hypothetical protein